MCFYRVVDELESQACIIGRYNWQRRRTVTLITVWICQDYLGTTVTTDNLIEEEIQERTAAGHGTSFANQKILQSKLISKKTKMKLYKALVRPVAVYGSECWVLTENIKHKL